MDTYSVAVPEFVGLAVEIGGRAVIGRRVYASSLDVVSVVAGAAAGVVAVGTEVEA